MSNRSFSKLWSASWLIGHLTGGSKLRAGAILVLLSIWTAALASPAGFPVAKALENSVMAVSVAVTMEKTTGVIPCGGFSGAIDTPSQVGFSDKSVTARFGVAPYKTTATTLSVDVYAFHLFGIDKVVFYLDGIAAPKTVRGTHKYTVTVEAIDCSDGVHELRAVAYPISGVPRVLADMYISTNYGGTLTAESRYVSTTGSDSNNGLTAGTAKLTTNAAAYSFTGHAADGGTIYLAAGTYTLSGAAFNTQSTTTTRWMTVMPAPGVDREDVIIEGTTGSGFNSKLVRLYNVTITGTIDSGGGADHLWLDSCHVHGTDMETGTGGPGSSWGAGLYMTDSTQTDMRGGPQGYTLVRDVSVHRIGGDCFSNSQCVIDCSVHEFGSFSGAHADTYQALSKAENVILYNVQATDQAGDISSGLTFEVGCDGMAVVNCHFASTGIYILYFTKDFKNLLFQNTEFSGAEYPGDTPTIDDVVWDQVTFNGTLATAANHSILAGLGVVFR